MKVGYGSDKKLLISGSIPTIFKFKKQKETPKQKSPQKRNALESDLMGNKIQYTSSSSCKDIEAPTVKTVDQVMENPEDESELLQKENEILWNSVENLKIEFNNLKLEYVTYRPSYCYEVLCDDTVHFRKATGLELDSFNEFFTFLDPGINCNNIKFQKANFENKDIAKDSINTSLTKRGPKPKILS